MKKVVDIYFAILISIIMMLFVCYSLDVQYSTKLIISFIIVIALNLVLMMVAFNERDNYFEVIISIFYLLFFIIAPVVQIKNNKYPNYFIINERYIILANICNSVFIISFLLFKFLICKIRLFRDKDNKKVEFHMDSATRFFMAGIFIVYFMPNIRNIFNKIIYRKAEVETSQIFNLITQKFVLSIPLLFVFYYLCEFRKHKRRNILTNLVLWTIFLIICKNPLVEKRNAIGPIYLSILCFLIMKKDNSKRVFKFVLVVFLVLFPLSSSLTNTKVGLVDFLKNMSEYLDLTTILGQFKSINFDAFANLNVAIEYVDRFGVSWGNQLLSAILFFIPRNMWSGKALSSGAISGNYLIDNYGFFFNNLSCPITAEAYYNYGIIGVVIFAGVLAMISQIMKKWLRRKNYYSIVAWYIIIDLFFILRGDLMNAIAYLTGTMLAIYVLPSLIMKVVSNIHKI